MKIEMIPISEVIPYDKNPRKNSKAVDVVVKSIKEFGFRNPILIDKGNTIIAGHTRLKAAVKLGMKEVPVIWIEDLTEDQIKAYRIMDNKSTEFASWDMDLLKDELKFLDSVGFDVELTGFSLMEAGDIIGGGEVKEDDFVAVDAYERAKSKSTVKTGEVYLLGDHRLMCGDSTIEEDVKKLLAGQKSDMVFTDPPYGIKRDKGLGVKQGFRGKGKIIPHRVYDGGWDEKTPEKECFDNMLSYSKKAIIFGGNYFTDKLPQSNHWIVWDKKTKMPTFGDAELMWTNIDRNSVSIIEFEYSGLIGREKERFHPTQKPIGLLTRVLKDYSEENNIVLDIFGGSGSILIACEKTKRKCFMLEIDPVYCQVIIDRWEKLTSKKAERI